MIIEFKISVWQHRGRETVGGNLIIIKPAVSMQSRVCGSKVNWATTRGSGQNKPRPLPMWLFTGFSSPPVCSCICCTASPCQIACPTTWRWMRSSPRSSCDGSRGTGSPRRTGWGAAGSRGYHIRCGAKRACFSRCTCILNGVNSASSCYTVPPGGLYVNSTFIFINNLLQDK